MTSTNPLLDFRDLPRFDRIHPSHVTPAVTELLNEGRSLVSQLEQRQTTPDWESFVSPLEAVHDRLDRMWAPVSHLNGVRDSEDLRAVYENCLVELSKYYTELGQNRFLFDSYRKIQGQDSFHSLDQGQRKVIDNSIRDFRLSGVDLEEDDKQRYSQISERLSVLGNNFGKNILDATDQWSLTLTQAEQVAGLPESALELAASEAVAAGESGWRFTLKAPCFIPFMTYADNRFLREQLYTAYVTRASNQGSHDPECDNSQLMVEILKLRAEKAALLGFRNYASYSLETRMADSAEEVESFLENLAKTARPAAQKDLQQLEAFARDEYDIDDLKAWDMAYYSEKLKQKRYQIDQELLRPWFPLPAVLDGLFAIVNRLFGISVRPLADVETWHEDVRVFEILDAGGEHRGRFYVDLYARGKKRGGAWMAECVNRRRGEDGLQSPVAFLVCNFSPPVGKRPALLTHDEVTTLFHEFGHGLQHLLTQIDYAEISGINGVPWDAVELPSQFLENWCWEQQALDLISSHFETGEPLPGHYLERLKAGKKFQAAMQMVRQLEFALFDIRLHSRVDALADDFSEITIQQVLDQVREEVAVVIPPGFNRFQNSFSHIFAGGYAAGYYSYLWAEVLSSDAFSLFEENGIFDAETGASFMHNILEPGGSEEPAVLFKLFRGREPSIDALLRHHGLT